MSEEVTPVETEDTQLTDAEKTEKRLSDKDSHIQTIEQENRELRDKFIAATAKAEAMQQFVKPEEPVVEVDPFALTEEEELEAATNPKFLMERMRQASTAREAAMQQQIVDLLKARDSAYDERISSVDPEIQALKPIVEELKADKSLEGLDDKALMAFARREKTKRDAEEATAGGYTFDGQTGAKVPSAPKAVPTKESHPHIWQACFEAAPNCKTNEERVKAADKIFESYNKRNA